LSINVFLCVGQLESKLNNTSWLILGIAIANHSVLIGDYIHIVYYKQGVVTCPVLKHLGSKLNQAIKTLFDNQGMKVAYKLQKSAAI